MTFVVRLTVPADVCAHENLAKLAVFAYHPVVGWDYVPDQTLDYDRRTFIAQAYESQVFAVLGAESLHLDPDGAAGAPGRLALSPEDQSRRAAGEAARRSSRHREVTGLAENEDAAVVDLSEVDRARVARLIPPTPLVPQGTGAENRSVPQRVTGGLRTITPAVPPGWVPRTDRPGVPALDTASPWDARPPGASISPGIFGSGRSISAGRGLAEPSESQAMEPQAPPITESRDSGAIRQETETEEIVPEPGAPPDRVARSSERPDGPRAKPRVAWSDKSPAELFKPEYISGETFILAPDPSRASPMLIGKNFELRPPYRGALFRLNTASNVRAQAILREALPEALPRGYAAFTPVFEVLCRPPTTVGTTAITITLEPGTFAPERFGDLQLYEYDRADGWTPMYRQKSNAETSSFSALDLGFRIYAVLGPEEAAPDGGAK